jgi:2-amino-4-hydroxy-6-hydroxymethyldihydropteridine diphosphokinase
MPPSDPAGESRAVRAYVGLGANLGDARATLQAAMAGLDALPRCRLVARSSLYRTAPVDAAGPDFLNAVAEVQTSLAPLELLAQLQAIEQAHGRDRPYRNAPRTLDLDLLLYGDRRVETPTLTVPHPRAHERVFVLAPLLELDPAIAIPGRGPARELLARIEGQSVERLAS